MELAWLRCQHATCQGELRRLAAAAAEAERDRRKRDSRLREELQKLGLWKLLLNLGLKCDLSPVAAHLVRKWVLASRAARASRRRAEGVAGGTRPGAGGSARRTPRGSLKGAGDPFLSEDEEKGEGEEKGEVSDDDGGDGRHARPLRPAAVPISPGSASDASTFSDSTLASAGGGEAQPLPSSEYLSEERLRAHICGGGRGGAGAEESKRSWVLEWQAAGEAAHHSLDGRDGPPPAPPKGGGREGSREALQSQLAQAERVMQHQKKQLDAVNNVKVASIQRRQDELQAELDRLRAQLPPAAAAGAPAERGPGRAQEGAGREEEERQRLQDESKSQLEAEREARQRAEQQVQALQRGAHSEHGERVARLQKAEADLQQAQASARGQVRELAKSLRQESSTGARRKAAWRHCRPPRGGRGTSRGHVQAEREARLVAEQELRVLQQRESELARRLHMIDEDRKRAEENLQQVKVAARGQRDDLMQQLQHEQQGRSRADADLTSLHRSAKEQEKKNISRLRAEEEQRLRAEDDLGASCISSRTRKRISFQIAAGRSAEATG